MLFFLAGAVILSAFGAVLRHMYKTAGTEEMVPIPVPVKTPDGYADAVASVTNAYRKDS